jgi:hypothetical protein
LALYRLLRRQNRFSGGNRRFHPGDVEPHRLQECLRFRPFQLKGIAVARLRSRLRCASAFAEASADKTPWQARTAFGNIIVMQEMDGGRGVPPLPSGGVHHRIRAKPWADDAHGGTSLQSEATGLGFRQGRTLRTCIIERTDSLIMWVFAAGV